MIACHMLGMLPCWSLVGQLGPLHIMRMGNVVMKIC